MWFVLMYIVIGIGVCALASGAYHLVRLRRLAILNELALEKSRSLEAEVPTLKSRLKSIDDIVVSGLSVGYDKGLREILAILEENKRKCSAWSWTVHDIEQRYRLCCKNLRVIVDERNIVARMIERYEARTSEN